MLKHIKNFLTRKEEKAKDKVEGEENDKFDIKDIKTKSLVIYSCNGCWKEIIPPKQNRYACNECSGFDICDECYKNEMILLNGTEEEKNKLINIDGYKPIQHLDSAPLPHLITIENHTQFELLEILPGNSVFETMENVFKYFSKRQCLGYREIDSVTGNLSMEYKWLTYDQVYKQSIIFANAMSQYIEKRDFISICMDNCVEWYISDFSSLWAGLVVVPLHHNTNNDNLLEILSNSETKVMSCSSQSFKNLVELYERAENDSQVMEKIKIKLVVHKEDEYDQSLADKLPSGVVFKTFKEMLEIGEKNERKYEFTPIGPNDLSSVTYTSGSTGTPKGVMKIDSIFNKLLCGSYVHFPNAVLSYNTLSHSQRLSDWRYIYMGGRVGIYSGDMNKLFEDLQLVRPFSFWGVPRMFNLLFTQFKSDLKQYMLEHPELDESVAKVHCYKGIRALLGNRISNLVTGGAPTSQEVLSFIKDCWKDINLSNSYGLTEVSGVCVDGYISDDVEFKIEPVPSFGYYPTDLPNPRGELVVKSSTMSSGYYKNEDLTSESFANGWFRTGDIVEQIGNRKVKIIDRIKHAFKLAQGEFVTPEPLENHFVSLNINQIFIYGNSLKSFLVAIVKPSEQCITSLNLQDIPKDQLIDNPILKSKLLSEINRISKEKKLANYEIPKMISIEFTDWNIENKLITGSGKFNRGELFKFYKDKINQMFDTIDKIQDNLRTTNNNQADGSSSSNNNNQVFENYIKSILNITDDAATNQGTDKLNLENLSFIQIGGDSLGAIKLSTLLKEKANIDISPSTILNQDFNLSSLSKLVTTTTTTTTDGTSKQDIEFVNDQFKVDWKNELILDQDIKDSIIKKMSSVGDSSSSSSSFFKSIFITGVTGYLGTYLLSNLLECKNVESIYCLIRNVKNESEGFELIEKIFKKASISNNIIDIQVIKEKVKIVIGDLSKPMFGISSDTFKMLSNSIDMVIHNGAIVNMAYPYTNMKSTNVTSTRDILRLCCSNSSSNSTSPFKKLVYVSTIGVYFGNNEECIDENSIPSTEYLDYGNGYNQSKLVSDYLVREAASLGLPTMIFRPGTIFSNTQTGFNNQNDFVGLIIKGILSSKSYPINTDYSGGLLNLSPVDWVSSSIISLISNLPYWSSKSSKSSSSSTTNNPLIFNMVNQNKLKLDQLCNFINQSGCIKIEPISYSLWKEIQFSSSSNPLYSVLPIFKNTDNYFPTGKNIICPQTQKYLENIGKSQCNPITSDVVSKYVNYLISNNLIQNITTTTTQK